MKGGHPTLQATTSHPITSTTARSSADDARGSSLGRNIQPPTSSSSMFPPPSSGGRPPSQVAEEPSDVDTDTETSVARSDSVKLIPTPGLLPPPPPNPRMSPWKELTKTKGHSRSVSHGGVTFTRTGSNRERQRSEDQSGTLLASESCQEKKANGDGQFKVPPLPSALKRPGHRRVFSECAQINPDKTVIPGIINTAASLFVITQC